LGFGDLGLSGEANFLFPPFLIFEKCDNILSKSQEDLSDLNNFMRDSGDVGVNTN